MSDVKSILIDNIDSDIPIIIDVDAPTEWTNQTSTVTVYAIDDGEIAYYSFDEGKTWQKSNKHEYSYHANLKIKVKDAAGHESEVWNQEVKVDKIPPDITISGSCTGWTNKTVLISMGGDDVGGSHIWGYSFDGGKTWISGAVLPFSGTTNRTLDLWVQDYAGNITKKTAKLMIDMEKPIIKSVKVTPNMTTKPKKPKLHEPPMNMMIRISRHSSLFKSRTVKTAL